MPHINERDLASLRKVLEELTLQIANHTNSSKPPETSILNPVLAIKMLTGVHETLRLVGIEGVDELSEQVETLIQELAPAPPRQGNAVSPVSLNNAVHYARQAEIAREKRVGDLKLWWMTKAESEVQMVAAKAVVYGSNSLEQLGRKTAQLAGRQVDSEEAQELGCWINLVQKTERWTDAVMRGERPKDDTITDIATYSTMALRIRNAGGWPDSEGA